MNAILSIILSFVLAFGGGALPAVPETATAYTISDIVLTVDDETVALNPSIVFTAAAGAEQIQAQFGIELEDDVLLPLAGDLTADGVKFGLGSGRTYSLSAETLNALTGMSEPVLEDMAPVAALQEMGELFAMVPEIMEEAYSAEGMADNWALTEKLLAQWIEESGATPETVEIDVNGVTVPATHVELVLSEEMSLSSLDLMRTEGSETMQAYTQKLLDLIGTAYGSEFASYEEMFAAMTAEVENAAEGTDLATEITAAFEAEAFPYEVTFGSADGVYYSEAAASMNEDGVDMDISAISIMQDGVTEMSMNMCAGDEEFSMQLAGAGAFDVAGNYDLGFEIMIDSTSAEEPADGNIAVIANGTVGEDGLKTTQTALTFEISDEIVDMENDLTETTTVHFIFAHASAEALEEDGSITTEHRFELMITDDYMEVPLALSFAVNRAEVPFADAFSGMELVELPADTENEAYQILASEPFGLLSDLMALSMEESVAQAMELFQTSLGTLTVISEEVLVEGSDDPAFADGYFVDMEGNVYDVEDGEIEYPEYIYDSAEGGEPDFAAAAEMYGAEMPAVTAPEGYELTWIYASDGYCGMDFYSEDHYFSVSMNPAYDYLPEATMFLAADGSLIAVEGTPVHLQFDENGAVLNINFTLNDTYYNLYVDGIAVEDVQQYIACVTG